MRIRRLLVWLLAVVMCFSLVACQNNTGDKDTTDTESTEHITVCTREPTTENTEDPADDTEPPTEESEDLQSRTATPLLYRVTDENGNVVWLFGSIHVGREDYYPLPDYVMNAFHNADSLAVEVDIIAFEKDTAQQVQAMTQLIYTDGTTIKDHIPQDLYEDAVAILKDYKVYVKAMDRYCPALWSSMIESVMVEDIGANIDLGIDRHLINLAYEEEKEVVDVESAEFQYTMMAEFDDDIQLMLLASSVAMYDDVDAAAADLEVMMDLWASGDEAAFTEYLSASDDTMTDEEKEIYERYNQAMVTDRNVSMADFAENALLSGDEVFICVGAAHVVGVGAMAELLSQRGYTVECITE